MVPTDTQKKTTILLIGTLPPPIGGTSVSLQHLMDSLLSRKDIAVRGINTSNIRNQSWHITARNFFIVLLQIFKCSRKCDIITLHVGLQALPMLAPIVWAAGRWQRKPLAIRRFGGNDHRELKEPFRSIVDPILRQADLYLLQTKAQLRAAADSGFENVVWFPTSRPAAARIQTDRAVENCRRFVFLSQVKLTKGIPEILAAAKSLPDDFSIDIYGPLFDGLTEQTFSGHTRVQYKGQVSPEMVLETLRPYHALLLPTYYPGEGYPGIILEALSLGMPVITTRWKSIPEIVDEECGILIPPRDVEALKEAITGLGWNETLYQKLSIGAIERHRQFDLDMWVDKFVTYCKCVIENHEKDDIIRGKSYWKAIWK